MKHHLKLEKLSSKWIPHELTLAQRQSHVENLQKIESCAWKLGDKMTGDESWFHHRKIPSKQDSKKWVSRGNYLPTEVRRQQYEAETMFVMFFMTTGPLLIHQVPARILLDAIYYRDEYLKVLVKNLHKKRTISTTNSIKLHHDNASPHTKDITRKIEQSDDPSTILT